MKGMNKITRGPKPLRFLWITFVTTMTTALIVATCLLVRDFLLYDVNINAEVRLNSKTSFPSITICHHHPFSTLAYDLWKQNKILSPSKFNRKLRNLSHNELLMNNIHEAARIIFYDKINVFYQHLEINDSLLVGHQKDIFLSCMYVKNGMISLENDCFELENFAVKRFSHHEHFNCYTFETKDDEISTLGIIVSMGPAPDYANTEQAFISDMFLHDQGLKVMIHEPRIPPDIDNGGIHVQPGKIAEIRYKPVEWELENTPRKPCYKESEGLVYIDLKLLYEYTQNLCLSNELQKSIIQECKCIYIYHSRLQIPTEELPYCGNFFNNFDLKQFNRRLSCLYFIMMSDEFKKSLIKEKCFQRCKYTKYETSVSMTKLRATEWHLHWMKMLLKTYKTVFQNTMKNVTQSKYFKYWLNYWKAANLTKIDGDKREKLLSNENIAYIVLRRESDNSVRKYEKLEITPYVLGCRIAGVCSLTIVITASFFVHIIEFLYVFIPYKKAKKLQTVDEKTMNKSYLKNPHKNESKSNASKCKFKDLLEPTQKLSKTDLSNNSSDQIEDNLL